MNKIKFFCAVVLLLVCNSKCYSQDTDIEKFNKEHAIIDAKGKFGNLSSYYINVFYSDDAQNIKNSLLDKSEIVKLIKTIIPEIKQSTYLQDNGCSLLFHYHINKYSDNNEYYGNIYFECLRNGTVSDTKYENALSVFWGIASFIHFGSSSQDMKNSFKNNIESLLKDFAIRYYQGK
jgi:hypothetical protein